MSQVLSYQCDECDEEFDLEEGMDLPPYWIGTQMCLGNQFGIIPDHEMDIILHLLIKKHMIIVYHLRRIV